MVKSIFAILVMMLAIGYDSAKVFKVTPNPTLKDVAKAPPDAAHGPRVRRRMKYTGMATPVGKESPGQLWMASPGGSAMASHGGMDSPRQPWMASPGGSAMASHDGMDSPRQPWMASPGGSARASPVGKESPWMAMASPADSPVKSPVHAQSPRKPPQAALDLMEPEFLPPKTPTLKLALKLKKSRADKIKVAKNAVKKAAKKTARKSGKKVRQLRCKWSVSWNVTGKRVSKEFINQYLNTFFHALCLFGVTPVPANGTGNATNNGTNPQPLYPLFLLPPPIGPSSYGNSTQ